MGGAAYRTPGLERNGRLPSVRCSSTELIAEPRRECPARKSKPTLPERRKSMAKQPIQTALTESRAPFMPQSSGNVRARPCVGAEASRRGIRSAPRRSRQEGLRRR